MDKPQKKTKFAVELAEEEYNRITVWADPALVPSIEEFGRAQQIKGDQWILTVDARYDFTEVQSYFESLDESKANKTQGE